MTEWLVGSAVFVVAVAYLLGLMCSAAGRSVKSWALASRHARRAATARAAACSARARAVREQSCGAYDVLRRARSDER